MFESPVNKDKVDSSTKCLHDRTGVFHRLWWCMLKPIYNLQVEPSALGSGEAVQTMLKEAEQLFAARFGPQYSLINLVCMLICI